MSNEQALTVAVLAGGRSSEHAVSLSSAEAVSEGLRDAGHEAVPVLITPEGRWMHGEQELTLRAGGGLLGADVAFPALHGPFGEDGTVQGMLETLDVAYVGAGVAASALCMNKVMFKDLLRGAGMEQVEYLGVESRRWQEEPDAVLEDISGLGLPVFVKPAHLGSSVGIARATSIEQLAPALDGAFSHDALVIVEAMATGIEVECGVLGQQETERESAIASTPGQILFDSDWYDYSSKYEPGGMRLVVPAEISTTASSRIQELALAVFALCGCEGLARVDFFLDGERALVNELNTMPGFTPTSVYAKLLAASGVAYPQLVDRLCKLALERHRRRRTYRY